MHVLGHVISRFTWFELLILKTMQHMLCVHHILPTFLCHGSPKAHRSHLGSKMQDGHDFRFAM